MFKITPTELPGVLLLQPNVKRDSRGCFVKPFQTSFFLQQKWETAFNEIYYSVSDTNVLRGLHFQTPPAAGAKMVGCVTGKVHDVLLDLRRASPTYGRHVALKLDGAQGEMVSMPSGIAHGFWVEQGPATLIYYQQAEYAPEQDKGLAWNKANIAWPCHNPIVSDRDAAFPALADFDSPFSEATVSSMAG
jgi:dTDP-4-dehydrorhamnose 3,5-epimerase